MPNTPKPQVAVVTLGCDKNTVDNEYLAAMLEGAGCEVVVSGNGATPQAVLDAAIVTTCGFLASAREQSIDAIAQLAERKEKEGSPRRLYVAGCLSQKIGDQLIADFPQIDGLVGVGQMRDVTKMILRDFEAGEANDADESPQSVSLAPVPTVDIYEHLARKSLESGPHAFLKVSDGCDHACSFCAIPSMKGKLRSVEPEILLAEARDLLARGAKELNLVAQDLSEYGKDRWRDYRLPHLLRDLAALPGEFWIRCLYYYPGNVTDDFLQVMAEEDKVIPYLEMPLQHLDPDVLRKMKRPFHNKNTFETIERIRAAVPGIALRTTFIVGFPGETQRQFQYLLKGMARIGFDRLGAFEYSQEDGTPAAAMKGQVDAKTRAKRWRMVMDRQAKISERIAQRRVGTTERVLIESWDAERSVAICRGIADAPNIDANVVVQSEEPLQSGQFVDVTITSASTYDVAGDVVDTVTTTVPDQSPAIKTS